MKTQVQIRALALDKFAAAQDVVRPCTLVRTTQGDYNPATGPGPVTTSTDNGYVLFTNSVLAKRIATGREVEPNAEGALATGFTTVLPDENDELTVDGTTYRVSDSSDTLHIRALFELMLVPK